MAESQLNIVDVQVGARVRMARTSRNLSEQGVAQELGISCEAYCALEKGHRRFSAVQLQKLSRLFDVNAAFFLGSPHELAPRTKSANYNSVYRPTGVI